jgi:hypothetical protein
MFVLVFRRALALSLTAIGTSHYKFATCYLESLPASSKAIKFAVIYRNGLFNKQFSIKKIFS